MKGAGALATRLTVTVGLLAVLVLVVAEPWEILARIGHARLMPMVAAIVLSAVDRVVMAYKWWLLLRAQKLAVRLWTVVRSYFASSLIGFVLPVTVGADAVRVLTLRQLGMLEVTASIVIERGLGVIAMASVCLISSLLLASIVAEFAVESLVLWLTLAIVVSLILFVGSLLVAERWAANRFLTSSRFRQAVQAYGQYRRHPTLLTIFYALSVGESLMSSVIVYIVAIGLDVQLPFYIFAATVPIALASARLPISLGGFGVQEASFVFLAGLVGVSSIDALSIMLVSDAAMLLALLPSAFDSSMITPRRRSAVERVL